MSSSSTPPGPPPQRRASCLSVALMLSLLVNLLLAGALMILGCLLFPSTDESFVPLSEFHYSGNEDAKAKIAIVEVEGVLFDGMVSYELQQLETVARDEDVEAIVLRINSPGGTISASEEVYQRIVQIRDGTSRHSSKKRTVVVSMGALTASGGYYLSAPAQFIFAERTTITGSIGVYAAFPNVEQFATKHGIAVDVIKRGAVKNSGSPFHQMQPVEREVWQEMVDEAYRQFLTVIEQGRPSLKGKLQDVVINELRVVEKDRTKLINGTVALLASFAPPTTLSVAIVGGMPKTFRYLRRRADGGIYTAQQAKKLGLVDEIGTLEAAIEKATSLAGLSSKNCNVVRYVRPSSLIESLLGLQEKTRSPLPEWQEVRRALQPRLWYLMPQSEMAGWLAPLAHGERK